MVLAITVLSCNDRAKQNGQLENSVTIDANDKADGDHRFVKIDHSNFYIDDIKYTVKNGDLVVSGYDEAFFKGEAKIITQLIYDGRAMKVQAIGESAFAECTNLKYIDIPDGVTSIGEYAFFECNSLASITIPESVTIIDNCAFSRCFGLTSLTIPNGVTNIGSYVFGNCNSLTSVAIPNSVTTIGTGAFYNCSELTSITIPENVTSIESGAFEGCSHLIYVKVKRKMPVKIDFITFTNRRNATLLVPIGCKSVYESSIFWNEFKEIIEVAQ